MKTYVRNEKFVCKTNVKKHNKEIFSILQQTAYLIKKGMLDQAPNLSNLNGGNLEEFIKKDISEQRKYKLKIIELTRDSLMDYERKMFVDEIGMLEDTLENLKEDQESAPRRIFETLGKNDVNSLMNDLLNFPIMEKTIFKLNGHEMEWSQASELYKEYCKQGLHFKTPAEPMQTEQGLFEVIESKTGYDTKIEISYNDLKEIIEKRANEISEQKLKEKRDLEMGYTMPLTAYEKKAKRLEENRKKNHCDVNIFNDGTEGKTIYAGL